MKNKFLIMSLLLFSNYILSMELDEKADPTALLQEGCSLCRAQHEKVPVGLHEENKKLVMRIVSGNVLSDDEKTKIRKWYEAHSNYGKSCVEYFNESVKSIIDQLASQSNKISNQEKKDQ